MPILTSVSALAQMYDAGAETPMSATHCKCERM